MELHASNRILRNYEAEFALTVSFRDHDFQKLSHSAAELVPNVVYPVLLDGIKVRLNVLTVLFNFSLIFFL